jgi:hypothetical protein
MILCHAKHGKEIYYQFEDEAEAPTEDDSSSPSSAPLLPTLMPSPAEAAAATPVSLTPAATIEDTPIKAIDVLTVIIAQKLKKKIDDRTQELRDETIARHRKKQDADLARLMDILRTANYRGYVALEYEAEEEPKAAIPRHIETLKKLMG